MVLASLYVRCPKTSWRCGVQTPRSRTGGAWLCVRPWVGRWSADTTSQAPHAPVGTCSNQAPPKLIIVLQVGDKAPDFKLPTTGGQELTLPDALEKFRALILLFYVLDFTGG
ncbi:MAG: redoxin domain-containing protein [Chloroflexi bacterium]|nr:MAG: redoxin domain-containing protein [Chloroflexota bacterium]